MVKSRRVVLHVCVPNADDVPIDDQVVFTERPPTPIPVRVRGFRPPVPEFHGLATLMERVEEADRKTVKRTREQFEADKLNIQDELEDLFGLARILKEVAGKVEETVKRVRKRHGLEHPRCLKRAKSN